MHTLLVVDDEPGILHAFGRVFREPAVRLFTADTIRQAVELFQTVRPEVVVLDVRLPDGSGLEGFRRINAIDPTTPVLFITGHGTTDTAIEAIKNGALDYLFKPLDLHKLREAVQTAFEVARSMRAQAHADAPPNTPQPETLIGRCDSMQEVYKVIGRLAPRNIPVLILGESGTGKELAARALWSHSPRVDRPFLAVNCASIPDALLESELFGHEKGAFTGADRLRIGKFEQCHGGTLFLDEIGEMPSAAQAKILRVIQEQRFERVGGEKTIQTDVRLIAATNRDEHQLLSGTGFRADLFYRLSVSTLTLPPLRQRGSDIALLAEHFLERFRWELDRKDAHAISPEALELLEAHDWPGNVRELQSVIKQALLHGAGPLLTPEALPERIRHAASTTAPSSSAPTAHDAIAALIREQLTARDGNLHAHVMGLVEARLLRQTLELTNGNQALAARRLGISRGTLRAKMREYEIEVSNRQWSGELTPDSPPASTGGVS